MAPAYLLVLVVFGLLGLILFIFAVKYVSKPLCVLSVLLSALLFCACTIFTTTDTIETEDSKHHLEYGWPLRFLEANMSQYDPPIGYKMRLSGEPTIVLRPALFVANYSVYLVAISLLVLLLKSKKPKSVSSDKKITKIALSILLLVCLVPGGLVGISHLANESGEYYCRVSNAESKYERYHYPSHTIPDKTKCKPSPLVLISMLLEILGLRDSMFI